MVAYVSFFRDEKLKYNFYYFNNTNTISYFFIQLTRECDSMRHSHLSVHHIMTHVTLQVYFSHPSYTTYATRWHASCPQTTQSIPWIGNSISTYQISFKKTKYIKLTHWKEENCLSPITKQPRYVTKYKSKNKIIRTLYTTIVFSSSNTARLSIRTSLVYSCA